MKDLIERLRTMGPDLGNTYWGEITCLCREAADTIERLSGENEMICFITGKRIVDGDDARFTYEFDAWVSSAGQNMIDEWVDGGMTVPNMEWESIYREWYAADQAATANEENDYFRRNHK